MEVKIGVLHTPREIVLESAQTPAEVEGELQRVFDPLEGVTDQLQQIEQHDAGSAHRRADQDQRTSLALIGGVDVNVIACAINAAGL